MKINRVEKLEDIKDGVSIFLKNLNGEISPVVIEMSSKSAKEKAYPVLKEAVDTWMDEAANTSFNNGFRTGFIKGAIIGGTVMIVGVGVGYLGSKFMDEKKSNEKIEE